MTEAVIAQSEAVERVRAFWNTEACGTHFISDFRDDGDFFAQYCAFRYRTEWHIPAFAAFEQSAGRQVLEIGCGNGVDGVMFARHGARYTGVDLTAEAVAATRRHFAVEGLPGQFRQENCLQLSFADNTFDTVYSFGVLHHTPDPARAIREVHRVLKPGGVARVMLYNRHSFNYYVRILTCMRARALLQVARRAGSRDADRRGMQSGELLGIRGNATREIWEVHYRNFLREGWGYFRARNFVHHCTDGPECPYAFTTTSREARRLFAQFRAVRTSVGHFPLNKYAGDSPALRTLEKVCARTMGWHLLIEATK
ncbi:MAG TPA: class I SAM-dependent methyltransferase [Steroidobacteraceae bacterium]|nr:class I SAM-dependent methyltransferase [Steroidobacteraceae bacterium]